MNAAFAVKYSTERDENLFVLGSSVKLGGWFVENAARMTWTHGSIHRLSCQVDDSETRYKFIVARSTSGGGINSETMVAESSVFRVLGGNPIDTQFEKTSEVPKPPPESILCPITHMIMRGTTFTSNNVVTLY